MRRFRSLAAGAGMLGLIAISVAAWVTISLPAVVAVVAAVALWMTVTRVGRQGASITWVGLSTLPQRVGASSVVVVGIGCVVGVLVALLSMSEGLQKALRSTGSTDTAIVLRGGATAELSSGLSRADATLIAQQPGILQDASGRPIVSPEVVVVTNVPKKSTGLDANVELRGVGERAFALRPNLRIVQGRVFKPGLRELIVGKGARQQFRGLEPGRTVSLNNQLWSIVGAFSSGDAHESELMGDVETLSSAYRRNGYQSVTVRLTSPQAFDQFKASLASDPRLKVDAKTTLDYYSAQSERLSRVIRVIGITVAAIMAVGAVFGALNTMYAAVAARAREIATLRAIGFGASPVIASVMLETMVLALAGGLLGSGIAWLAFDRYTVSTLGANFSQVVFQFNVSPALLWTGIKWALAIGFIGGMLPALRAARVPVTVALRES